MLVVDDSRLVRKTFEEALSRYSDIDVVGTACDAYVARDKIVELKPDVVTLDIEMPIMDGLTFLRKIMQHRPLPVIILSAIAPEGSEKALEAFSLGAVDVLSKPGDPKTMRENMDVIVQKIRIASGVKINKPVPPVVEGELVIRDNVPRKFAKDRILVIGASTGGTEAIQQVLSSLPANIPPTLIVQHMPEKFTGAFAERLNTHSPMTVREAKNGDRLETGLALLAPGGSHMLLNRAADLYTVQITDGPLVHYQRPAVDVLFKSAAKKSKMPVVAALLTGMGSDGAKGMLAIREAGHHTIAQDEKSCVVYGMPKVAIELGAAVEILSLNSVSRGIIKAL